MTAEASNDGGHRRQKVIITSPWWLVSLQVLYKTVIAQQQSQEWSQIPKAPPTLPYFFKYSQFWSPPRRTGRSFSHWRKCSREEQPWEYNNAIITITFCWCGCWNHNNRMHKYHLVGSPVVLGTLQWVSMATPLCVWKLVWWTHLMLPHALIYSHFMDTPVDSDCFTLGSWDCDCVHQLVLTALPN